MATKKPTFVFWDGSTVGQKDIGKVKPTPKPAKPIKMDTPKTKKMTPQDAAMKKILEKKYGMKFGKK